MSGQELQEKNKKVIGAKKHLYDGIKFDSSLEISCYKHLKLNNIPFEYNTTTYTIFDDYRLKRVNYFQQKSERDKNYLQLFTKKGEKIKFSHITLTPDFRILLDNYLIIIETKGHPNDVYPYKRKIFLKFLEDNKEFDKYKGIYFFEPRNIKQIKTSIEVIKKIIDEETRENTRKIKESS